MARGSIKAHLSWPQNHKKAPTSQEIQHDRDEHQDNNCRICGDNVERYHGQRICVACREFYHKRRLGQLKLPTTCTTGRNKCLFSPRSKTHCAFCRLQKFYANGFPRLSQGQGGRSNSRPATVRSRLELKQVPLKGQAHQASGQDKSPNCSRTDPDQTNCSCRVCDDPLRCVRFRGVVTCNPCYMYIHDHEKQKVAWPTRCARGDNKCDIIRETRTRCSFCRMMKMKSLGLLDQSRDNTSSVAASELSPKWGCRVCGQLCWRPLGPKKDLWICEPCYGFLQLRQKCLRETEKACVKGTGDCRLTLRTRTSCGFCRLRKLRALGYFDQRKAEQSTGEQRRVCQLCESPLLCRDLGGVCVCVACHIFIRYKHVKTIKLCRNNCRVFYLNRPICKYCRLLKASSLGLSAFLATPLPASTSRQPSRPAPTRRDNGRPVATPNGPEETIGNVHTTSEEDSHRACNQSKATGNHPDKQSGGCLQSGPSTSVKSLKRRRWSRRKNPAKCNVCGRVAYALDKVCTRCHSFYQARRLGTRRLPQICKAGHNNCIISGDSRRPCAFCRLQKLYANGYPRLSFKESAHPSGPTTINRTNGQTDSEDEEAEEAEEANETNETNDERQTKAACLTCGDKTLYFTRGVATCRSCNTFINRKKGGRQAWPSRCVTGNNKCVINVDTRFHCHYCRMQKMISLGVIDDPFGDKKEANERQNGSPSCGICADTNQVDPINGVMICHSCRNFIACLRRGCKWPTKCKRRNRCKMSKETRSSCRYCRMVKMRSFGVLNFKPSKRISTRNNPPCLTCGDTHNSFNYRNIATCVSCYKYVLERQSGRCHWPSECRKGDGQCEVTKETRASCSYCRASKMKSLGLIDVPLGPTSTTLGAKQTQPHSRSSLKSSNLLDDQLAETDGSCQVCGDAKSCRLRGVMVCLSCRTALSHIERGATKRPSRCKVGTGKCPVTMATRTYCRYCRVQKMSELGLMRDTAANSTALEVAPDELPANSQESDDTETTISDGPTEIIDDDQVMGQVDEENDDEPQRNTSTVEGEQNFIGFGRRFYGDLAPEFRSTTWKDKSKERLLIREKESALLDLPRLPTNRLGLELRLVTSGDLSLAEWADQANKKPVRAITSYSFQVTCDDERRSTGEPNRLIGPPELTVTLKSSCILVDGRPMMKKDTRSDEEIRASQHPDSVIEPGEDCDPDWRDRNIIEVDCDL